MKKLFKKLVQTKKIKDLTFPKEYNLETIGTTQSMLQNFLNCPMLYLYNLNKYNQIGRNTTGFGSMFHEMLDKIYSYYYIHKEIPTKNKIVYFLESYINDTEDLEYCNQKQIELMCGTVLVLLTQYIVFYEDDFTKLKFNRIEGVQETKYKGYTLRGKIDLIFRIRNFNWIMEHKTKGKIEEKNLLKQLTFDFQNLFYITIFESMNVGESIRGVLYNIIRRPRSKPLKNESLIEYLDRLEGMVKKDPYHYFKRMELIYTPEDKKQFKVELIRILKDVEDYLSGRKRVYKRTTSCVSWYTCEFLDACSSGCLAGYEQRKLLFPELDIGI